MRYESLFDQVFDPAGNAFDDLFYGETLTPVHEEKENWVIYVDMPGVKKEDVKVSIDKDQINIEGKRKGSRPQTFKKWMRPGNTADLEDIEATLVDGILEVRIRKQKVDSPRLIKIQ